MRTQKVIPLGDTIKSLMNHPTLGGRCRATYSDILAFKRKNFFALKVRNYAMNTAQAIYTDYDEED